MVVLEGTVLWGTRSRARLDNELYSEVNDFRCNPMIYKFYDLKLFVYPLANGLTLAEIMHLYNKDSCTYKGRN